MGKRKFTKKRLQSHRYESNSAIDVLQQLQLLCTIPKSPEQEIQREIAVTAIEYLSQREKLTKKIENSQAR